MKAKKLGCDYQGSHFGARYDDACCIDGYLWDLDSGGTDELSGANYLDIGGDIPCPQCNAKQYVKSYLSDYLCDAGYESLVRPLPSRVIKNPLKKWPSNLRRMGQRYWRTGRREALKEARVEG
ncbi:hypothetical protein AB4589_25155 [Vibrio sp. 10N.222.49.A3]|uniref:hypothetical protein n=1 Tax=Vibrio sp. 10N.222.49.A3 TaxID=3229611 RepID=UPI003551FBAC